jgi:DNA-binding NarL/FixJ family response regulator
MDSIKEAFSKVKQDIANLESEISSVKQGLVETRKSLVDLCELVRQLNEKIKTTDKQTDTSTPKQEVSTYSTHNSTNNTRLKALKHQYLGISTGNKGASTDRQTLRQTDRQTPISSYNQENINKNKNNQEIEFQKDTFDQAIKALDSLDSAKKEIRLKFKRLTDQEWTIFSVIYQIEQEQGYADYRTVADRLNLTESSIRDYVGRLIKKDIPLTKQRVNNKNIQLNVSENLKKIANLSTIIQLREL